MLKNLCLSFVLVLFLFSTLNCLKSKGCTPKTPASETTEMQAFATANGIVPTIHPSGLFYEIINPGTGSSPSANSTVYITYVGKLLNGTVFDQRSNASETGWPLGQLIEGWKEGIPLLKKGGQIKLIVPSSMAYGCKGKGIISPDTILYFEITLVDFL
jgi:FKBP-type peptidyl-prolyl cis-trans isomerase FkpA